MSNSTVALINDEINRELADPKAAAALLATTFKGLSPENMKQAITEGMIRGFSFKDFLEKKVYAIPYSNSYSLVTSIDHARVRAMRAGIIGKSAPQYEFDEDGNVISCSVTVKRMVGDAIGEFTATVYFDEYTTNKNLWASKPRTMIAKVAEMHALRMACPEELAQSYVEEEFASETKTRDRASVESVDLDACTAQLRSATTTEELRLAWANLPPAAKQSLEGVKNEMKTKLEAAAHED